MSLEGSLGSADKAILSKHLPSLQAAYQECFSAISGKVLDTQQSSSALDQLIGSLKSSGYEVWNTDYLPRWGVRSGIEKVLGSLPEAAQTVKTAAKSAWRTNLLPDWGIRSGIEQSLTALTKSKSSLFAPSNGPRSTSEPNAPHQAILKKFTQLIVAQHCLKSQFQNETLKGCFKDMDVFVTKESHFGLFHQVLAENQWDLASFLINKNIFDLTQSPIDGPYQGEHAVFMWMTVNDGSDSALNCLELMLAKQPVLLEIQDTEGYYPLGKHFVNELSQDTTRILGVMLKHIKGNVLELGLENHQENFPLSLSALQDELNQQYSGMHIDDLIKDTSIASSFALPKGLEHWMSASNWEKTSMQFHENNSEDDKNIALIDDKANGKIYTLSPLVIASLNQNIPLMVGLIKAGADTKGITEKWCQFNEKGVGSDLYFVPQVRAILYLAQALSSYANQEGFKEKTAPLLISSLCCHSDVVGEMLDVVISRKDNDKAFILEVKTNTGEQFSLSQNNASHARALFEQLESLDLNELEEDRENDLKRDIEDLPENLSEENKKTMVKLLQDTYPSVSHLIEKIELSLASNPSMKQNDSDDSDDGFEAIDDFEDSAQVKKY